MHGVAAQTLNLVMIATATTFVRLLVSIAVVLVLLAGTDAVMSLLLVVAIALSTVNITVTLQVAEAAILVICVAADPMNTANVAPLVAGAGLPALRVRTRLCRLLAPNLWNGITLSAKEI